MGSIAAQVQRKGNVGSGESFCRRWSCVTSNDRDWKWSAFPQDWVKFSFVNSGPGKYKIMELYKDKSCSPSDLDYLKVSFTEKGKRENIQKWINGMSWGIVFYKYGGGAGSTLTIRLRIETAPPPWQWDPIRCWLNKDL